MITTKNVKLKDYRDVKLDKMITTNKTQPKEFTVKGKGKPRLDITINTANIEEHKKQRKIEVKEENRKAKIRQKKYNEKVKMTKEKSQDSASFATLRR